MEISVASLCLGFALTTLACESGSAGEGGADAGTDSAGTEGEGDDGSGDESTEEGSGAEEESTTEGEPCVVPQSEAPSGAPAMITISNDSDQTRYVHQTPGQCAFDTIKLSADGVPVVLNTNPIPCSASQCTWFCDDGMGTIFIVPPGESFELPWDGLGWVSETVSEACQEEFACEGALIGYEMCDVRHNLAEAEGGGGVEYLVQVTYSDSCPEGVDCESCEGEVCTVPDVGWPAGELSAQDSAVFPAPTTLSLI